MARIQIRTLHGLSHRDVVRLAEGYTSQARYVATFSDRRGRASFTVVRKRLRKPFVKAFAHPREETRRYRNVVRQGWSLGAYADGKLVGILITEPRAWNGSVWVWELGVASTHRRRGIGRRMVEALARRARGSGYRVIVCETQTTNAPAIDFYRAVGFRLEAVDVSYYSNEDLRKGEVAIFMKKRIPPRR